MRMLCVGVIASIATLAAGAPNAFAVLTLRTATGPLAAGAEVVASDSALSMHGEVGNLECTSTVFAGTLTSNAASKDKASFSTATSTGEFGFGSACNTTTSLGPAEVTWSGLPWSSELTTAGVVNIKGNKKMFFEETFPQAEGARCVYEAAKIAGTFKPGPAGEPAPVELTFSKQPFKVVAAGSDPACNKALEMSGEFATASAGEQLESEL